MKYLIINLCLFLFTSLKAQTDNVGSGRALLLDGIDDFVSYGDVYHNVNLPFSVSAWVYLDPASGVNPIFCTNDNPIVYRGFIFFITPTTFGCEFGDGTGGNNPAFRRGKIANVSNVLGRWIHVCVVFTAPFTIDLYINGVNVGGNSSGASNLPMVSSIPGDIAKSGYYISNSSTYRFMGMIDEVRLWNRSLTQDEVRQGMCKKLTGNESGLIGYWSFDETTGNVASDKSSNGFNGQIMGNPIHVFSGAPIGDDSKYLYTTNWSGNSLSLQDGDDQIAVNNIQGSPEGIHVYEVKNKPSQTGGLTAAEISQPYFGAFTASLHIGNSFDASYLFKSSASCQTYTRPDNSISSWTTLSNPATAVSQRAELIKKAGVGQKINFSLGPDVAVCSTASVNLSTGVTNPIATFLWSTGETTSSINVIESGNYSVKVTGDCGATLDTIAVKFETVPPSISLGADQVFCKFNSILLDPLANSKGYQFLWQDNSTGSSFLAKDFGKYWVTVRNDCGAVSDTVTYTKYKGQVDFDLGSDTTTCSQQLMTLTILVTDPQAQFLWSTGEATPSISVSKSGTYSATVTGVCGIATDKINVKFESSPSPISLGADQTFCEFKPILLDPLTNSKGYHFLWQDNSTDSVFHAKDFGKYWVTVRNECGAVSDTITYTTYKSKVGFVPNVITPNGDDLNEYFKIDDKLTGNVSLLVMNRWGKVVYQSSSYINDWSGGDLSPGTYYVVIQGPCIEETKDWLTILR